MFYSTRGLRRFKISNNGENWTQSYNILIVREGQGLYIKSSTCIWWQEVKMCD